jgi:hypothetical protein
MTTQGFVVSHARGASFERGLRSFYEYRDLGIKRATAGRVDAHVIRATAAGPDRRLRTWDRGAPSPGGE